MSEASVPKILILDDEVAQMKALCNTLQDQHYHTAGFSSAKAALAELEKRSYDLVLTDLMMPEMDGISFLQVALAGDPNLVGIVMTGQGTIQTAVEAMKAGALDYVLKPFKLSTVLPVLERALAVRRLRHENRVLQRNLRDRTEQLEAANKELEAFSYSVSHDLRKPVQHIDGFAEALLKSESGLSAAGRTELNRISDSARYMGKLIDDLLEFSRVSRAEINRIDVNLNELVEEVIRATQPETVGRRIVWKKKLLPRVPADPTLLRQVLANLVFNAVKYTRPRPSAEIEIGCQEGADNEIVIFIRDNGVGFDMQYVDKLFGVFQRLHTVDQFEGTGIGLANVQRIIARHHGRVWAEGKVDSGATFYFSLPKLAT